MSKLTAEQILTKYKAAFSIKTTVDTRYKEVFELVMPDRDNYNKPDNDTTFDSNRENVYTSAGINSSTTFVNRIQADLTPIKGDWIEFQSNQYDEDKAEKDKEHAKVAALCNFYKNKSNFDQEAGSSYADLVAGTCCMLTQKGKVANPFIFEAITIKDICVSKGVGNEVGYTFRKFKMKREMLPYSWPELRDMKIDAISQNEDAEIYECTQKDYEIGLYRYYVVDDKTKNIIVYREAPINNFTVLRWYNAPGEMYGRGVGLQALPDLKTLNKMTQYSLRTSAFNLPTFTVTQDGIFDPDEFILEPGAMNPVESNDVRNPSIAALPVNTNQAANNFDEEKFEMRVKRTMLDNPLPDNVRPGITATEIMERTQASNVNISSIFGRLENEWLIPLVKNMVYYLEQFGIIKEGYLDMIENGDVRIVINTPLMKMQQQGQLMNVVQMGAVMLQFDPTGRMANAAFKVPQVANYLMDKGGVPDNLQNSPEEMTANLAQMDADAQAAADDELEKQTDAKMAVDTNKKED